MTMTMTKGIAALALTLGLAGCGKGDPTAEFEAFMKLDGEKATAFAAGGADCAAKAKVVGEWRTKNAGRYKQLRATLAEAWPKGPPKALQEKHGEAMKANKAAVMDAMMTCTNDPAFDAMMDATKDADK
jgi:hypothetical protein